MRALENPLLDVPRAWIERDADKQEFLAAVEIWLEVSLLADLPQGRFGRVVKLEFDDIDAAVRFRETGLYSVVAW